MCYRIQLTNRARNRNSFDPIFDRICDENQIEHRLIKVEHPWTNDQVGDEPHLGIQDD